MTRFVSQDPHAFGIRATLNLKHLFAFEFHEARMGQVKRNGNARHAVRREPFFRKPDVRLKPNAATIQFTVQPLDVRLEKRSLKLEPNVADPHIQQVLVGQAIPWESIAHFPTPFAAALENRIALGGGSSVCEAEYRPAMTGMQAAGLNYVGFRIRERRSF